MRSDPKGINVVKTLLIIFFLGARQWFNPYRPRVNMMLVLVRVTEPSLSPLRFRLINKTFLRILLTCWAVAMWIDVCDVCDLLGSFPAGTRPPPPALSHRTAGFQSQHQFLAKCLNIPPRELFTLIKEAFHF